MSLFVPPRRFDPHVPEIMDRRGNDAALLRADLHVLDNINRFLGGHRIALDYLDELLDAIPMNRVRILDLATGGADVPRALAQWARQQRIDVEITAVDGNPEIITIAREQCAAWPEIQIEQHDLLALPHADASFDIVLCSLALHHFSEANVVAILRRIHDIARVGYIINDLRRNRIAIGLSKLMARTIISNPIARFDAPASCERAFSVAELRTMATHAGLHSFTIHRHRFFSHGDDGTPMSVCAENSIVIKAPVARVFQETSNLLQWPKVLPHYRWIHILSVGDDGLVVKMAARRGWLPIQWTSRFKVDPNIPELHFEHLKAFTRGMKVRWTYTSTADGVSVGIIHELDCPSVFGRWFAHHVLCKMFIQPIATRTLSGFKAYLEQNGG